MDDQEELLVDLLLQIRRGGVSGPDATTLLRKRLIAVGSATPDNASCVAQLEVGRVHDEVVGLAYHCIKVKGRNISVSDVVHKLEGLPMLGGIRKRFPDLTQQEWNACMRATTLIMLMFERAEPYEPKRSKRRNT